MLSCCVVVVLLLGCCWVVVALLCCVERPPITNCDIIMSSVSLFGGGRITQQKWWKPYKSCATQERLPIRSRTDNSLDGIDMNGSERRPQTFCQSQCSEWNGWWVKPRENKNRVHSWLKWFLSNEWHQHSPVTLTPVLLTVGTTNLLLIVLTAIAFALVIGKESRREKLTARDTLRDSLGDASWEICGRERQGERECRRFNPMMATNNRKLSAIHVRSSGRLAASVSLNAAGY